jgi:CrcB protein
MLLRANARTRRPGAVQRIGLLTAGGGVIPRHVAVSPSHGQLDILAVIAVGGALGSLARWGLTQALPHGAEAVSVSIWVANVSGALILGALMVFVSEVWPPRRYLRPFWGVGVLGGFTTFSAYMLDTRTLLAADRPGLAAFYLFGTLATGLPAAWLGVVLARAAAAASRRRAASRHQAQRDVTADPDEPSSPDPLRSTP